MEKGLQLLYARMHKLNERSFDLNTWKQGTVAVIDSVLGPGNMKRKLIEEIDFQNNSWSLRDTTGDVDSLKKTCADVLETIIQEIETFGLAEKISLEKKEKPVDRSQFIHDAMRNELSQSQMDEVLELVKKEGATAGDIVDKFKRFGYEVAPRILAGLLMDDRFK